MIKNVVFDVGMVLVDFRWRELMEDLDLPKELQEVFGTKVFGSRISSRSRLLGIYRRRTLE